ncbi:MAG: hypothetical protein M1817_002627 [Caeruleum heppii]|nr:MAG: hypothetical protein M1817_002627 [Caeruleum heppii]
MASLDSPRSPPSTAAIAFATSILTGVAGYFVGQGASLGLFSRTSSAPARSRATRGDDSSSEDDAAGPLDDFEAHKKEEYKLVLVVRTDLGMSRGKMAAQCAHATLACYKTLLRSASNHPVLKRWERQGQAKVAVQTKSEEELETLQAQALSLGLCAQVIHDAGRTQIEAGSATVLGVGPGPKSVVDKVTGGLKLL